MMNAELSAALIGSITAIIVLVAGFVFNFFYSLHEKNQEQIKFEKILFTQIIIFNARLYVLGSSILEKEKSKETVSTKTIKDMCLFIVETQPFSLYNYEFISKASTDFVTDISLISHLSHHLKTAAQRYLDSYKSFQEDKKKLEAIYQPLIDLLAIQIKTQTGFITKYSKRLKSTQLTNSLPLDAKSNFFGRMTELQPNQGKTT